MNIWGCGRGLRLSRGREREGGTSREKIWRAYPDIEYMDIFRGVFGGLGLYTRRIILGKVKFGVGSYLGVRR